MNELVRKVWVLRQEELHKERLWIEKRLEDIGEEEIKSLATQAAEERKNAHATVTGYLVGAALKLTSGDIITTSNTEIKVRPIGFPYAFHAEGTGVWQAVLGGEIEKSGRHFVEAVAVSHQGGLGENWSGPCGICLQDLYEFCDNALVIIADTEGDIQHITSLRMLMTRPFTPSHLEI